jgi:hypothetical protein
MTLVSSDTYEFIAWRPPSVSDYPYTIWAEDSEGNIGHQEGNITVEDTTAPIISTSPEDLIVVVGYSTSNFTWIAIDPNPCNCSISLLGEGVKVGPHSWTSGEPIVFDIPEGLSIGEYNYSVLFTDIYGNEVTDTVSFIVKEEIGPPIAIPFNLTYLLFTIISILILVHITKRKIITKVTKI